ncbi:DNA alkylation repair protein [Candidatus Woesebacteria bacterium RIFCSPHIGHO2_01_FULL_38_9]|uniref:DNA alkylation repair protein n=2 Tax=Candidatus Woeseibacteriota TaxID=1752722 RepID=A0A1F7Y1A2_9BACT|nr:MAG: DNA alkylation repair protein [Candidatus Woesebacteria bacterium RIFCSPHIGHO2_01_FULL_38_9]OGM60159.1 MAG: DNA alkylation repair protein [Candidatus Woesebacteria bacterium RIFCSPLOWO2_01_FULL_39_10]
MLDDLKKELKSYASKEKAKFYPRFFKAGSGEYAEGDKFIGVSVPNCRMVAKKYENLSLQDLQEILSSKIHEERLVALLILVEKFRKGDEGVKEEIYKFYLKNTKNINNWDLVDLSADKIVGDFLYGHPDCTTTFQGATFKGTGILYRLAKSDNVWERRIAIIATFYFIKSNRYAETLKISEILLDDNHDLIHKGVGWMLREVGKRSQKDLEGFLKKYYKVMPRTMLRYSIEKFPEDLRKKYLRGKI